MTRIQLSTAPTRAIPTVTGRTDIACQAEASSTNSTKPEAMLTKMLISNPRATVVRESGSRAK